jgi:hypothetical protein
MEKVAKYLVLLICFNNDHFSKSSKYYINNLYCLHPVVCFNECFFFGHQQNQSNITQDRKTGITSIQKKHTHTHSIEKITSITTLHKQIGKKYI